MNYSKFTYGVEHEFADFPLAKELPAGFGRDPKDITIVNSNGVANDPTGRYYGYGGEINTPPTNRALGQALYLEDLKKLFPMAKINHRSNLHIHIRWPGLKDNLELLKRIQRYIHQMMPLVLPIVEPIVRPTTQDYPKPEELKGALRRWRRRRVSHHTLLTPARLERQLKATTLKEFFALEVPQGKNGRPQWQCQPRLCVNLRQLLDTDTVEFRHFPGTLDSDELLVCIEWCRMFLLAAADNDTSSAILVDAKAKQWRFPGFPLYLHWRECRYRATVHDGSVSKADILANIRSIEAGTFDEIGKVPIW